MCHTRTRAGAAIASKPMRPARAGKVMYLPIKANSKRVTAQGFASRNFSGHWQGFVDETQYRRPLIDYLRNKYSISETDAKRVIAASVSFFDALCYIDDETAWEMIYKAVTTAFGVSGDDDLSNMLFSSIPL